MKKLLFLLLITSFLFGIVSFTFAQETATYTEASTAYTKLPETVYILNFPYYDKIISGAVGYVDPETKGAAEANVKGRSVALYDATDNGIRGLSVNDVTTKPELAKFLDDRGTLNYRIIQEDMKLKNWKVTLNSSAQHIENIIYSYAKAVATKTGEIVLGVRIHYPTWGYNCWARIAPPFEFLAYDNAGKIVCEKILNEQGQPTPSQEYPGFSRYQNEGIGVVPNVGETEKVFVVAAGRRFKNSLALRLKDQNGDLKEYFMGYLNYTGWRILQWKNPNYIANIDQMELFQLPLYPREVPYRKFDSFIVYRQAEQTGGDFVLYVRNVYIKYDQAISDEELKQLDIDDEFFWRIHEFENKELAEQQRVKYVEQLDLMIQAQKKYTSKLKKGRASYRMNQDLQGESAPTK